MKKLLLGTTAIVGASFVATAAMAAPEIRIGGSMDFQAGMSSQDTDGFGPAPGVPTVDSTRGFGFVTDTEVVIRASDKLDNGLAWAVKIELEADADNVQPGGNDNTDEASITFSGTWGQLVLGNEDGPVDAMNFIGDGQLSGLGVSGAKGYRRWTDTASFSNDMWVAGVDPENTSDATKIMYYTPKFAGFQAGVSYSADSADNGRSRSADNNDTFENWWETGVSYETKFGDFGVGLTAAASFADAEDTTVEDIFGWLVSGKVEFGGFTVSAGYGDDGDSGRASGDEVSGYAAAVKYTTGPYQVGVSYMHNMQDSGPNDFTSDTVTLGVNYALASGVRVYADSWYYTNDSDGFDTENENEAIGLLVGTQVSF